VAGFLTPVISKNQQFPTSIFNLLWYTKIKMCWRRALRIYMDVCCLNRPFDDCNNDRISIESDAILKIIYRCQEEAWRLLGSDAIDLEISRTSDPDKKRKVLILYSIASTKLAFNDDIESLSQSFQLYG